MKKSILRSNILFATIILSACGGSDSKNNNNLKPTTPISKQNIVVCDGMKVLNANHKIRVVDGDTIHVTQKDGSVHKIRLAGIDAPENSQEYGIASKNNLEKCVANSIVSVQWFKKDRYNRLVGKVVADTTDCNLNQISTGAAWHYKAYQKEQVQLDRALYSNAEVQARTSKTGLWSKPKPTAPWDYRRKQPSNQLYNSTIISTNGLQECPTGKKDKPSDDSNDPTSGLGMCASMKKKTCKTITSCIEAKQQLICGNTSIDGNKDGIPCQSLCK